MQQQRSNKEPTRFSELRREAEVILSNKAGVEDDPELLDVRRLLSELHIHQIELEIQNEELRRAQVQLSIEREKYSDMFNFAPVVYFTFDENGIILDLNMAAADLLEHTRKYLANHPIVPYLVPDSLQIFVMHRQKVLATGQAQTCELVFRRKNGEQVIVQARSMALETGPGEIRLWRSVMTDITEHKKAESIQQARGRVIDFASTSNLEALLQYALDELCNLTDSPIGFFHFVEEDQNTISLQAWSTRTLEEMCKAEGKGQHYSVSEAGVWVDCVREGQPVIHNDYANLPYRKGLPEGHAPIMREMVFPIYRKDKIVAIIGVGNKPNAYMEDDMAYAMQLADMIWEIVERKRSEQKLRESEERFRTLVNSMDDIVYTLDTQQRHTGIYGDWVKKVGLTPEYFLGKTVREILGTGASPVHEKANSQALEGQTTMYEWSSENPDGSVYYQTIVSPLLNSAGNVVGIVGVGRDISASKRAEEAILRANEELQAQLEEIQFLQAQLREQTIRDPLTGLYNRRFLQETLTREIARARRIRQPVGILVMDIDHFKGINDQFGHDAGDKMLKEIGNLITSSVRTEDVPCRTGGEEFVIIMPGASIQVAQERALQLREQFHTLQVEYNQQKMQSTASIGVAVFPYHGDTGEDTLIHADRALYQSKQNGRDRVSVFQDSIRTPRLWKK